MTTAVRTPAVAGRFYPRRAEELEREIRKYTPPSRSALIQAVGCIAPHAGYVFSGHVAGAVYAQLDIPRTCVVLCPNHTGMGVALSIMTQTAWQTPLGTIAADTELGAGLLRRFSALEEDSDAHRSEHAIEVQLPFLQARRRDIALVPIVIGTSNFDLLRGLGEALAQAIAAGPEKVLIIASSDMNHYESDAITRLKDHKAIERVLALDARGLWEVVMNDDIGMCGFGPAVAMLTAASKLGASSAALVKYATSGDVSGDREQVVGYAGIIVK